MGKQQIDSQHLSMNQRCAVKGQRPLAIVPAEPTSENNFLVFSFDRND
jgi:hypothetical protein